MIRNCLRCSIWLMRFYANLTPLLSTIFQAAEFAAKRSDSIFIHATPVLSICTCKSITMVNWRLNFSQIAFRFHSFDDFIATQTCDDRFMALGKLMIRTDSWKVRWKEKREYSRRIWYIECVMKVVGNSGHFNCMTCKHLFSLVVVSLSKLFSSENSTTMLVQ